MRTQHDIEWKTYSPREETIKGVFRVEFVKGKNNKCPVPGCVGSAKDKFGLYRHFCLLHPKADIIIEEDGELEKCKKCGMRVKNLEKHLDSYTCKKGTSRRDNELMQDRQHVADKVKFYVNGIELERVKEFRYLGRIITDDDNDSKCIEFNLKKARQQWNCIARFLKREGASAKCMAKFYITIVQAVLLYGSDSWSISKRDMKKLQSFHKRAIRYMCGNHIRKDEKGIWNYLDHSDILEKCELQAIEVYLERRRCTLRNYLDRNRKGLLMEAKRCGRHARNVSKIMWWNQSFHDSLI